MAGLGFVRRVIAQGREDGWPRVRQALANVTAPGAPARPATPGLAVDDPGTPAQPAQPKGALRSRTIWAVGVAFGCLVAQQFGIEEQWVNTALRVAEMFGIGAAGYFRVLATVPVRGSRA